MLTPNRRTPQGAELRTPLSIVGRNWSYNLGGSVTSPPVSRRTPLDTSLPTAASFAGMEKNVFAHVTPAALRSSVSQQPKHLNKRFESTPKNNSAPSFRSKVSRWMTSL